MQRRDKIEKLIALVKSGRTDIAWDQFYHDDVIFQEADFTPLVGLAASIERSAAARDMTTEIHEVEAPKILIDGDHSVIEWHAEWTVANGSRIRVEELAVQTWRGDRIIHERFFYDPRPVIEAGLMPGRSDAA